jgi:Helicase associated domain
MSAERRDRLESVPGWSWNAVADSYAEHLAALMVFAKREGHTRVPVDYVENGLKLGQWTRLRRREHKKLSPERRAQLESVPGWYWGRSADYIWEQRLAVIKKFVDREGHARVSSGHVEDGVKLGSWVAEQRSNRNTLAPERVKRLEALAGWSWTFLGVAPGSLVPAGGFFLVHQMPPDLWLKTAFSTTICSEVSGA